MRLTRRSGLGKRYLIFSAVESKKNTRYFDDGIPSVSFYFPNKSLCVPVGIMLTRVNHSQFDRLVANPAECDIHDDQSSFRLMRDPYSSLEVLRC